MFKWECGKGSIGSRKIFQHSCRRKVLSPKRPFQGWHPKGGIARVAFQGWHSKGDIPRVAFQGWHSKGGIPRVTFQGWHSRDGIPRVAFQGLHSKGGIPRVAFQVWHSNYISEAIICTKQHLTVTFTDHMTT